MEPRNLGSSLKNVPLAPKNQYLQSMTRLRFTLNDYDGKHSFLRIQMPMKKDPNFECFKFSLTPPQNKHLTQFENHLYDMVRNIEFNTGRNDFQKTLMSDLKKIQSSKMYWCFPTKQIFMKCHQISTTSYLKTTSLKHTEKLNS